MVYYAIADIWSAFKEFNSDALLFGLAAALIYSTAIVMRYFYRRIKGRPFNPFYKIVYKLCVFTMLGVYTSYMISLTLSGREAGSRSSVNLIPGTTIFTATGISLSAIENLILFVPLGIMLPMLWSYNRSVLRTGLAAFFVSLSIEVTQFFTQRGYFETDDIILNTFGAAVGCLIFAYCYDSALCINKRVILDVTKDNKTKYNLSDSYNRLCVRSDLASIALQAVPVALCTKIIMGFSGDTGDVSRGWSRPVAFLVAKCASLFAELPMDIPAMSAKELNDYVDAQNLILDMVEKVVRKLAHITEYALLAFLVWILIISRPYIKRIFSYWCAIVAVMLVGMIDELNQTSVDGRSGSIKDVGIDLIGAVLVMIIATLLIRWLVGRRKRTLKSVRD